MSAGRPSLYRDEYCDEIVTHCVEGASITSFAAEIGVDRDTISEWTKVHPEFSVAVKRAKAKIAAWWNKQARDVAMNGGNGGRATMVVFGLKNADPDDFRDKTEHEHTVRYADLSDDELEAERRRLAGKREAAGD